MTDTTTETNLADDEAEHPGSRLDRLFPQTWLELTAVAVALVFLGGAVTFLVSERADRPPDSSSADVGFLQDMISHHEQALALSTSELDIGETPAVRLFAQEILQQQSWEIGLMQRQLEQWDQRRENRPPDAMAWMGMEMPVEDMPGLASDEEVRALRDAEGTAADALFVALMADHHRGGIDMAAAAAERVSDPWVRDLAERMARNQAIEIEEMEAARRRTGLTDDPAGYEPGPFPDHVAADGMDGMDHSGG